MSGTISGTYSTVVSLSVPGTYTITVASAAKLNAGLYAGAAASDWTITNFGLVAGTGYGVGINGIAGTVLNSGTITAGTTSSDAGVSLGSGGIVVNRTGGSISGYDAIYGANASAPTVVNYGQLAGNAGALDGTGIFLAGGGAVTNQSTGTITGYRGIYGGLSTAVTVANAGEIAGSASYASGRGILLQYGGAVINQSGASIRGYDGVVGGFGGALTVLNAGAISANATAAGAQGVNLGSNGSLTNQSTGSITGFDGVVDFAPATVLNAGFIAGAATGATAIGVLLGEGGSLTNQSAATITGYDAVYGGGNTNALILTNAGSITGNAADPAGTGVLLKFGGTITNQRGGLISGFEGISASGGGVLTVVNAGSIAGTGADAIAFAAGYSNRLVVNAGAAFTGTVDGGNTLGSGVTSTLELGSGTAVGSLSGLGTKFIDFAQISVDSGAYWSLSGVKSLAAGITLSNAGRLTLASGSLSDAGTIVNSGTILIDTPNATLAALSGTGTVALGAGGALGVSGTVTSGETIVFTANGGAVIVSPTLFAGSIDGFTIGDTISLSGVSDATSASIVNGNTLQVARSGHSAVDLTLDVGRLFTGDVFTVTSSGVVTEMPCFLRGTLIRTEQGDVPVESLREGDRVVTMAGHDRPITWIGTGRVLVQAGQRCEATPVLITQGALGQNVPYMDLRVTKGHSVYLDGVLIPAEFLVNHRSIRWDDHAHAVEFYHIELPTHDVLIANGAPAESYRDDGNRSLFHNANPAWAPMPEPPCVPVLTGGPVVDAVWRRLLDLAGPRPGLPLTEDADLHLVVDGERVDPAFRSGDRVVFRLARPPRAVRLASRSGIPAELGLVRDGRSLGVALRDLTVWQGRAVRTLDLAQATPMPGFHGFEADLRIRWTDGDAPLPEALFAGFEGEVDVELRLGGATRYPALVGETARAAA